MYTEATKTKEKAAGIATSALQFIGKVKEAVDGALASSPPASMAWAGVCLVLLPIVLHHAEQIAAKQIGFNYVMSRFTWYDQVLDLLNRDHWKSQHNFIILRQAIRDEVINLYKLLIEYQLRAYYAYCRPLLTISRDILKLDDWETMILEIKESEKRLQDYMDLNFEQHLLDKLHGLSEDAHRRQQKEMALKFKFPDELPYEVYQAYIDGIASPLKDTGDGVFSHPEFVKWASADSGIFVLSGIPGSGKSVIAKSMLTVLPTWRNTTVCSFFFKDNANGQNLAPTALCRILDELFGARIGLIDGIIPKVEQLLAQEVRCNLTLLWNILEDATGDTEPGAFTIVLDAIDECEPEDAAELCSKINIYLSKPTSRLKFFITTRPLVSVREPFDSAVVIKSNEDLHCLKYLSRDIKQVVASRFEDFAAVCIRDADLKAELFALVQPEQERTYLYAKLLFDFLDLKIRDGLPRVPRQWINVFKSLPATVKEAYAEFLGRVREAHRRDVKLMLQMVVAAARPLTVGEINIALNIRDHKKGSSDGLGLQSEDSFRDWILDACRFFLDVYNGRVYFIHQTAKDFLLMSRDDQKSVTPEWLGDFTMEICHETLAESCVAYLSLPFVSRASFPGSAPTASTPADTGEDNSDNLHEWKIEDLEFSNYASTNYRNHLNASHLLLRRFGSQNARNPSHFPDHLELIWSWNMALVTTVRATFESRLLDMDFLDKLLQPENLNHSSLFLPAPNRSTSLRRFEETSMTLSVDNKNCLVILNNTSSPVSRVPRLRTASPNIIERVANSLYSISLFRTISAITNYQSYSPIPTDWFSIRMTASSFNGHGNSRVLTTKNVSLDDNGNNKEPLMRVHHGDTLSYVLANRTESVPVSVHMMCLNASWTIGSPVWNEQILPGQEKCGNLAMIIPRKINEYDDDEIEDQFIVIFVVGDGQRAKGNRDRPGAVEEWLKRVYLPPVFVPLSGQGDGEADDGVSGQRYGRHLPFIPPPSWQIWRFGIRTVPRVGVGV